MKNFEFRISDFEFRLTMQVNCFQNNVRQPVLAKSTSEIRKSEICILNN
jgi:hypothetical protein